MDNNFSNSNIQMSSDLLTLTSTRAQIMNRHHKIIITAV